MSQPLTNDAHANVGYLTWEQWDRFTRAVHTTRTLVPWLRVAGYIRSGETTERVHASREGHIGLPPTWIAAEEITRLLQEINQWPDLEDAANDEYGAWVAWEFTRETETANARWPIADRAHRIRVMRCTACDALTLRYHPPRYDGDRVVVRCSDRSCGAYLDEDMFARAVVLIESENKEREQRRLDQARRSRGRDRKIPENDLQVG